MFGFFKSSPPQISLSSPQEAQAIARLHALSFAHGWDNHEIGRLILDKNVLALSLKSKNTLIGFILYKIVLDEAEILSVAIDTKSRGKGYSALLLKASFPYLIRRNILKIFLEVANDNSPALALYARHGFKPIGERKSYYGAGKHAITMQMHLPKMI